MNISPEWQTMHLAVSVNVGLVTTLVHILTEVLSGHDSKDA